MKQSREFTSKKRYLWAFLIGTAIFLLVFAISSSLSYLEFQRVAAVQTGVSYEIFEDKLDYSFFGIPICNTGNFEQVSSDLGFQGRIIDDLERKLGKQNEDVLMRKKFYSLIEIEHFDFVRDYNAKCGKKHNTILFFYSNNATEAEESEEAGRILGVVGSKYEGRINIYSFDVNLDSELVDKMQARYNVADFESPTVIINEKTKIAMPVDTQEIERHLIG